MLIVSKAQILLTTVNLQVCRIVFSTISRTCLPRIFPVSLVNLSTRLQARY